MIKEILQAIVVLAIGIPFLYMAYDVTLDIVKKVSKQTRPVLINIISILTNITK